jgi:DNA-binding CsgD family transcriptional regulator
LELNRQRQAQYHTSIQQRLILLLLNDGKTQDKIADFLGC